MTNKLQERIFVESAGRLLGADWTVIDIPEPLDFEIRSGAESFGLEVTEIFSGETTTSGSTEKRGEAEREEIVRSIAEAYYRAGGTPIIAKLLGKLPGKAAGHIASVMVGSAPGYPGDPASVDVAGVTVYMTPVPPDQFGYSRWTYIDDRVGVLAEISSAMLQSAVDAKAPRLGVYKKKYPEIDLLIVADRSFNSGRMSQLTGVSVINPGFRNIYFLSYPVTIQRVG